jgi:ABC-type bacteriocin/lantibiotic exporter with double-glycine peptidase domain
MRAVSIPHRKQETDFYCGPAIVQMILAAQGIELSQKDIARVLGTTEAAGTNIAAIERFLASHGFVALRKNDVNVRDIDSAIAAGKKVVVGYVEPSEDVPHYGIVAAVTAQDIIIIDPWHGADHALARDVFEERWRDDSADAYGNRMMLAVSFPHNPDK